MAYLALYRKYRPASFDELVGQDKVVQVIRNAIMNNRISHAYLFSGPRGTGKTTTAKIIAKMVNCTNLIDGHPCEQCDSCLNILNSSDIVEIDAASNNGVDEIRELRDKVNLVPTFCRYKIYIIDEVHMLTTAAFNALLKTMEEPPSHVIFILATTELHKIPLTILSRCQKFQFSKIDNEDLVKKLKEISYMEKIEVEEQALFEIARLSDGGCRDAINFLDQLNSYRNGIITIEDVYKVSGSVSYNIMAEFLKAVSEGDKSYVVDFIEKINDEGKNISRFIEEIMFFLKDVLVYKNSKLSMVDGERFENVKLVSAIFDDKIIFGLINRLNDLLSRIKVATYPSILFIVSMLEFISLSYDKSCSDESVVLSLNKDGKTNGEDNSVCEFKDTAVVVKDDIMDKVKSENKVVEMSLELKKIRINNTLAKASKDYLNDIRSKWESIFNYLLDENFGIIAGMLNDVEPLVVSDCNMMLLAPYDSLSQRLNGLSEEISKFFESVFGRVYSIVTLTKEEWQKVRDNYINDLKNGKKYVYISEVVLSSGTIDDGFEKKHKSVVDELLDIVGNDIIEYE